MLLYRCNWNEGAYFCDNVTGAVTYYIFFWEYNCSEFLYDAIKQQNGSVLLMHSVLRLTVQLSYDRLETI